LSWEEADRSIQKQLKKPSGRNSFWEKVKLFLAMLFPIIEDDGKPIIEHKKKARCC